MYLCTRIMKSEWMWYFEEQLKGNNWEKKDFAMMSAESVWVVGSCSDVHSLNWSLPLIYRLYSISIHKSVRPFFMTGINMCPGTSDPKWTALELRCECAHNALRMHWDLITQTTGGLVCLYPHSSSRMSMNVLWTTLKDHLLNQWIYSFAFSNWIRLLCLNNI